MTKEEAIELLKLQISSAEFYARYTNNDKDAEKELKNAEAFRMAIEALSEPKIIIGIDIPYRSDKGVAAIFKEKDNKLILKETIKWEKE